MGMAADRVLDSIREFTDGISPNNIAIGKMEIGWPGRVYDAESEREGDLVFCGSPHYSTEENAPLLNSINCGGYEQRVARNGLQFDNRTVISKNQMELDDSLDVRQARFLWVTRLHEMHLMATEVLLLLWTPKNFRGRRGRGCVLRRCLSKRSEQCRVKDHLS